MRVGDIVIITESFGCGEAYVGWVGKLKQKDTWDDNGVLYYYQVDLQHPDRYLSFICNCAPATDLLKALF